MTDTNGNVNSAHLAYFAGVPVSAAIISDLRAVSQQFHNEGSTFSLVIGMPGYRDLVTQAGMRAAYFRGEFGVAPYYLARNGVAPAAAGGSRHGFGRAVDIYTNASTGHRDAVMAANGFHVWDEQLDYNHFEWGNALEVADVSVTPLPLPLPTPEEGNPVKLVIAEDHRATVIFDTGHFRQLSGDAGIGPFQQSGWTKIVGSPAFITGQEFDAIGLSGFGQL